MKAFSKKTKLLINPKIPITLIRTNKMTLITKINKINIERKFLLNKFSKQQFRTFLPTNSIRKFNIFFFLNFKKHYFFSFQIIHIIISSNGPKKYF